MSKFTTRLLTLYNDKKELSKPPSYLKTLKQLLVLDGLLVDEEVDIPINHEKIS